MNSFSDTSTDSQVLHVYSDTSSPEIDFSSHIDVLSLSGNKDSDGNSINSVSDTSTDSTALYSDTSISTDYDGDSKISVSDASYDSTRLYSDSSSSNLDISVQYKGGLKYLYTNIDCISNKWTELVSQINGLSSKPLYNYNNQTL